MAAVKANGKEEAARAAENMGLKKDALLAIMYTAIIVTVNMADGVTMVEDFVAWVESEAKVAGQSVVDAIGEAPAPAPMEVEVPNRPVTDVMDERGGERGSGSRGEGGGEAGPANTNRYQQWWPNKIKYKAFVCSLPL